MAFFPGGPARRDRLDSLSLRGFAAPAGNDIGHLIAFGSQLRFSAAGPTAKLERTP